MEFPFLVEWYSGECLLNSEPAESIDEARNIISHWVPNMDAGDSFKIVEVE